MKKKLLTIFALSFFLIIVSTQVHSQGIFDRFPKNIKMILDRDYPGWKFSEVSRGIYEFFRMYNVRFDPNFIWGDFDGDSKLDYAVQITFDERIVIAFLQRDEIYEKFVLESNALAMTDVYLWFHKKGSKDYNYDLEEELFYSNDSIGVNYFERAGVTYIFENGKFQRIITSD